MIRRQTEVCDCCEKHAVWWGNVCVAATRVAPADSAPTCLISCLTCGGGRRLFRTAAIKAVTLFHSRSACTLLLTLHIICISNFSFRLAVYTKAPKVNLPSYSQSTLSPLDISDTINIGSSARTWRDIGALLVYTASLPHRQPSNLFSLHAFSHIHITQPDGRSPQVAISRCR
jgi:hypothetical protein